MDLLELTQEAFDFLQREYGYDPPSLEHEPRDDYDYVVFSKQELSVAVVFFPQELPSVTLIQYPPGMTAPTGLPYSKSLVIGPNDLARDLDRYPLHQAMKKPLLGWWARRWTPLRRQTELEGEIARCLFDLGQHVSTSYEALLNALGRKEA